MTTESPIPKSLLRQRYLLFGMILLVTSIEVYTKYMLRSDLEALQEHGRIDLEALGLAQEEDEEERGVGEMIVTALKNLSARTRGDSSKGEDDDQPEDEVAESPA